eukprot:scaffold2990_cov18-Tisochrysis_lutea.AAC.2
MEYMCTSGIHVYKRHTCVQTELHVYKRNWPNLQRAVHYGCPSGGFVLQKSASPWGTCISLKSCSLKGHL